MLDHLGRNLYGRSYYTSGIDNRGRFIYKWLVAIANSVIRLLFRSCSTMCVHCYFVILVCPLILTLILQDICMYYTPHFFCTDLTNGRGTYCFWCGSCCVGFPLGIDVSLRVHFKKSLQDIEFFYDGRWSPF